MGFLEVVMSILKLWVPCNPEFWLFSCPFSSPSQHSIFPVCHLRFGLLFLPLLHRAVGWGLLHHQRCQANLWRVQEHHVWPLPQLLGERAQSGTSKGDWRDWMGLIHISLPGGCWAENLEAAKNLWGHAKISIQCVFEWLGAGGELEWFKEEENREWDNK